MKTDSEFILSIFTEYGISIRDEKTLDNVEFENKGKVHEWRNYVSPLYQKEWKNLTYREKVIIYCEAYNQAEKEEWD